MAGAAVTDRGLRTADLAVDRALSDIALSFRFLLDVTPVDPVRLREQFWATNRTPTFEYRDLEDDPGLIADRLAEVPVEEVEDPTLSTLLLAKQRELQLMTEMLACRGTAEFRALSIEQYGAVSPGLLRQAESILEGVPRSAARREPFHDADEFLALARAEMGRYRQVAPDVELHAELREGSTGVMVSNGELLVAPTARVEVARADALLQHEVGTHVLTFVNGQHQPLRTLATGLAGHEETQEGLAVLAEHLVGGLTAGRLRQLAARVVAVHDMVAGAEFPEVYDGLIAQDVPREQAFTITMRVFRSGGLTKDAVYLRGLQGLVEHLAAGKELTPLWLGKMPLTAVPLIEDLLHRGALVPPLLVPLFLDRPEVLERLERTRHIGALAELVQEEP